MLARLLLICTLLMPFAAHAQEDDKSYLTRLLEDSLGGDGRTVQINGFAGAFSSEATVAQITFADADGIWLTLEDVVLNWNRSALLRGRIEIEELSTARISLPRLPVAEEDALPPAEAQGFTLPDLPVSVDINKLAASEIVLGAPVLGQDARLRLDASGTLANGAGSVVLNAERIDAQRGVFAVEAGFEGGDAPVALSVTLEEDPGGIVAQLLDLPGMPSVALALTGAGPLSDFTTDIQLSTDGAERLAGQITLGGDGDAEGRQFSADIGGDVTALFAPQYRAFFGDDLQLVVSGAQAPSGALTLDDLKLDTQALRLNGAVALNADNWPVMLDLDGDLGTADGTPVLLPLPGDETRVNSATLRVTYDEDNGRGWTGAFNADGFTRPGVALEQLALEAAGVLDGEVGTIGQVTADVAMSVDGVVLDDAALAEAVGPALSGELRIDYVEGQPVALTGLALSGVDYGLTGEAEIGALDDGFETLFDIVLTAQDLSRFSAISGQELQGEAELALDGRADLGGSFDIDVAGEVEGVSTGIAQADAVLAGRTTLKMQAVRDIEGTTLRGLDLRNAQLSLTGDATLATDASDVTFDARLNEAALVAEQLEGPLSVVGRASQNTRGWSVDVDAEGPFGASAAVDGLATGPDAALNFVLALPDIKPLVPQYSGAARLEGTAKQSPAGWLLDTDIDGPYGLAAAVEGRVTGDAAPDVRFDARLPDISPFAPQFTGPVRVAGTAQMTDAGIVVETEAQGPYGMEATVEGRVTGESAPDLRFAARLPNVQPLAPQFNGPLNVTGTAQMQGESLVVDTQADGPYGLDAEVRGAVTGPAPAVDFAVRLPNVAPLVPQFAGPLSVNGSARQESAGWFIDTALQGPAGASADVTGRVGTDGQLSLSAAGDLPLALANPFIEPRSLQGQARFDLRVDGPAALSSVSGRVTASDGRLSAPNFRIALTGINADVALNSGRAQVDLSGDVSSGGRVSLRGPVTLTGAMPAQLDLALTQVQVVDPALYRTVLDGALSINGPLQGGARIAGRINVGETQVTVPSTGLGGFTIVPEITHLGASNAVRVTQNKAGLIKDKAAEADGSGPVYPLDIAIAAPARIFVRGRGLDAELGGQLRLTGTTANIISAGRFELIRGRLDILEKRFTLDEGSIQLQGNFDPFLRFVATTRTAAGTASVIIEGAASEPEVRFESSPEAPQDEVLAQIFFGRDVSQLSAFQALQLANAVATLAGGGDGGIVSQLRRSFDLDDLDVTTDEDGNTALRVGKYISDNVYTDVELGGEDGAEVSLNIDLTPNLTARGSANSVGETSLGVFFEKDY